MHPLLELLINYQPGENDRLSWTEYFIGQALVASFRSPSKKIQVGAVIVKNLRSISTGYNGFLPSLPHVSINIDNHEVNTVHAEQNAIAFAAKAGISIDRSTIYVTHYPCLDCAKVIIASGIECVIYVHDYKNNPICQQLFEESNVNVIKFET